MELIVLEVHNIVTVVNILVSPISLREVDECELRLHPEEKAGCLAGSQRTSKGRLKNGMKENLVIGLENEALLCVMLNNYNNF